MAGGTSRRVRIEFNADDAKALAELTARARSEGAFQTDAETVRLLIREAVKRERGRDTIVKQRGRT